MVDLIGVVQYQNLVPVLAADRLGCGSQGVIRRDEAIFDDLQRDQQQGEQNDDPNRERNVAAQPVPARRGW